MITEVLYTKPFNVQIHIFLISGKYQAASKYQQKQ